MLLFLILADVPDTALSSWTDLAKQGGTICIFILLAAVVTIALVKYAIIPLNDQKNAATAKQQESTIAIANAFQSASEKMESSVARLDDMHERCHARDVDAKAGK